MSEPLVTCIVPCFNGARFLEETIRSMLAQTHRPLEIIIVDDGSTDGSADVARRFGDAVRYHRRENGGPGAACNAGITLARGEFIAFLEQDDLWLERKITRQLGAFAADADLDYCVTGIKNFWVSALQQEASRYEHHPAMRSVPGYVVQTLLARRRAFERVGLFQESLRFACATDWFIRASEAGAKGALISDVLTLRRLHEDNYSRQHREASREQFLHVIKAMLDRRRLAIGPADPGEGPRATT